MTTRREQAPLAESFLGLAKDCRYVASATHLIIQVLEAWDIVHSPADAWYASTVLYLVFVLRRQGRTLGMEITGLRYKGSEHLDLLRRTIFRKSLMGVTAIYLLHYWVRRRQRHQQDDHGTALRGSERRRAFESRRRAMIQGSHTASDSSASTTPTSGSNDIRHSSAVFQFSARLRQACQRLIENFMTFQTGGPHDLPPQQQSAAWWCLRLYSAYYCIDGCFPSLGSFLLGQQVKEDPNTKRLVNRPQSHRLVALLILSHSAGVSLQKATESVLRWIIKKWPPSERGRVHMRGSMTSESIPSGGMCAICQQVRKHPACPIQCGHTFCWECLQKWVTFRSECPVCRKPSRPQDILPLYNYEPSNENSS